MASGDLNLTNHGLIRGGSASAILSSGNGGCTIVNSGSIVGDIDLGGIGEGNDVIDNRGGVIKGKVMIGGGDDIFITDIANTSVIESANNGWDGIKSTFSYVLPDNFEFFALLRNNINGTGTDDEAADNILNGNSGNNILNGLGGVNVLFGRGGTDNLIGTSGNNYYGLSKGYGHDTVKAFPDGENLIMIDCINLSQKQLVAHTKQHGNDTWIEFGHDRLILNGMDHLVIDELDFTYFM